VKRKKTSTAQRNQPAVRDPASEALATEPGLNPAALLIELAVIARADVEDYVIDPGTGRVASKYGDPAATRAVSRCRKKTSRKVVGADGQGNPLFEVTEEVDIRLWNKVDALRLLAKVMGLYQRRTQPPPSLPRLGFDPEEG
jgi:hypothetical protein